MKLRLAPRLSFLPCVGIAIVALVAVTLSFIDTTQAYVASTTNKSFQPLGWVDSNCVIIVANSNGSADIDDGSDLLAIENAISKWHQAIGDCSFLRLSLQESSLTALPEFNKKGENTNTIYWAEELCATDVETGCWKHDAAAAAITTVSFVDNPNSERDGQIIDADVELNGVYFTFSTSGNMETDVENTVVHELGHLIGLDHPCDDGARTPTPYDHVGRRIPECGKEPDSYKEVTMYNFADFGETKKRSPEKDDVRGVCDLYPLKKDPGACKPAELPTGSCTLNGERVPKTELLVLMFLLGGLLFRRCRINGKR